LLVEQIEFANVIVLNKVDLTEPHELDTARRVVRSLNTDARIIETLQSRVPLDAIVDTGMFDFDKAHHHPLWFKELNGFKDHKPETEEFGIASFIYRARAPFEPAKLYRFFNQPWPGVLRAKGFFWLATRPEWVGEISQAGALVQHQAAGYWWAAVPREKWPADEALIKRIKRGWLSPWGDRRQEIVFIGLPEMDQAEITRELDACLLPLPKQGKVDTKAWQDLHDPFPTWGRSAA
jgi:G3E family GTPase